MRKLRRHLTNHDRKVVETVARKRGCNEEQVERVCDIIDQYLEETDDVMRYVKRRPIGFC